METRSAPFFSFGNLTSQLFANIYLNELDQFIKCRLGVPFYVRYCDDIAILHTDRKYLASFIPLVAEFLSVKLALKLHPHKILLAPYHGGVDFLGFICFPHYRILRSKTKRRMMRRLHPTNRPSYLGLMKHARTQQFKKCLQTISIASPKE